MALLDFIKNRGRGQAVAQQQTQQQQPETAKAMYTREAGEAKASEKPIAQIPDAEKTAAKDIGSRIQQSGQSIAQNTPDVTPDSASTPEAMRQDMTGQGKAQPALSPTDGQKAKTDIEKPRSPGASKEPDSPSPSHTPRPGRDGWER